MSKFQKNKPYKKFAIAFIIDSLGFGGAEKVLVNMVNHLDRSKFEPHLIITRNQGPLFERLKKDVHVHLLQKKRSVDIHASLGFRRVIKNNNIKIVHSHSHSSSYFVSLAYLFSERPFIHILHSHYGPIFSNDSVRLRDRWLLGSVDFCIAAAPHLCEYFTKFLKFDRDRCRLVLNGIDGQLLSKRAKKDNAFTIVQVGKINDHKGQIEAVEIAREFSKSGIPFKWIFVGREIDDNAYFSRVNKKVIEYGLAENIIFAGETDHVEQYLAQADVGVLTSNHEAMPLTLLEYMAAGLPVVVTDVGMMPEMVKGIRSAFVVANKNTSEFSQKIKMIHDRSAFYQELAMQESIVVTKKIGIERMVREIEEIYRELLVDRFGIKWE